jgi:hypothetical protein
LRRFLNDELSPSELESWIIASVDEEQDPVRQALWELRLLLTETGEGLRPANEAKERAARLIKVAA